MAKIAEGAALIAGGIALDVFAPGVGTALNIATSTVKSLAMAAMMTGASMTMEGVAQMLAGGPTNAVSLRNPIAPYQYIYGEMRVTGTPIYLSTTGSGPAQLNSIINWCAHQVYAIQAVYLDGRQVVCESGLNWGNAESATLEDQCGNQYNFGGNVYLEHRYGYPGQLVRDNSGVNAPTDYISGLTANDPNWTSECTNDGKAYSYIKLEKNTTLFPGWPGIKATIFGKNNIYDPRMDPTGEFVSASFGYTSNWALVIADFLCDSQVGFGNKVSMANIDRAQLIAAANICDEQVPLAQGATSAPTGSLISIPVTNAGYATGSSEPSFTIVLTGDGTGAGAAPIISPGTSINGEDTWSLTGITITPGTGYTTMTATIIASGWNADPILGTPIISGGTGTSTTNESRYTINGCFSADSAPGQILQTMLAAAEGRITITNGLIGIFPAAWYGTSLAFDEDDLVSGFKWKSKQKLRDLANGVRGQFVCPEYPYQVIGYDSDHLDENIFNGMWQPTDFPEYMCDTTHGYPEDAFEIAAACGCGRM
jgi:hypothetical protein